MSTFAIPLSSDKGRKQDFDVIFIQSCCLKQSPKTKKILVIVEIIGIFSLNQQYKYIVHTYCK